MSKNKKWLVVSGWWLVGAMALTAQATNWSFTEDGTVEFGEITEASAITINSGVTVTSSTAITGSGSLSVSGGGKLVLNAESKDYKGAINVGLGQLWVQAEGALGSGDVTVQGKGTAGGLSRIVFDLGDSNATFSNNFIFASSASESANAQVGFNHPVNSKQLTFNGSFTAAGDLYMIEVAEAYTSSESTERICFKGAMTVNDRLLTMMRCAAGYYGHLNLNHFYCYSTAGSTTSPMPQQNSAYIYSTTNEIGYLTNRKSAKFYCCTNDICKDVYFSYGDSSKDGGLIMCGYDQRLRYISGGNTSSKKGCVKSSSAATLTLYGGDAAVSATAYQITLNDAVSLVIDQSGDAAYSQTFWNAEHTMNGSITVKKGTLNFTGPSTLANVPEVSVTGGTLNMQSTADQAFNAVTTLNLSGGSLAVSDTSTNLFGTAEATRAVVKFSNTGTMNIAAGQTVYVYQAMTNGVWLDKGTYTGEAGVEGAVVIPQLAGTGTLVVDGTRTFEITKSGDIDIMELMAGSTSAACVLNIAADVVVTNTTALSGDHPLTVRGGGTLALKTESPDYNSAVTADNSQLLISVTNALGTGKVTLTGTSGAWLTFTGNNEIYFPNEIEINNTTVTTCISNMCKKCVTFDGAISKSSGDLTFIDDRSNRLYSFPDVTYMRFLKSVTISTGNTLQVSAQGAVEFRDQVTAGTLYSHGGGSSPHVSAAIVHLYSSDNAIQKMKVRWSAQFVANGANVCGDAYVGDTSGKAFNFKLGEYDQSVKYFQLDVGGESTAKPQIVAASTGATLTLDGAGEHSASRTELMGKLNLVINGSADTFVQTFKGGDSETTGAIEVRRGKLQLSDNIFTKDSKLYEYRFSMANVPEIKLTGGNLTYSGTNENVFASVTNLEISAGIFTFDGESDSPFGTQDVTRAVARFSGTGTMNIAQGQTVYVYAAATNGVWLDKGTYTCEDGAAGATVIEQLTGKGVLSVRYDNPLGPDYVAKVVSGESEVKSVVISKAWISENVSGEDINATPDNGNGYKYWKSYVLGLTPTNPVSKPIIKGVQNADPNNLAFRLGNVTYNAASGVRATYRVRASNTVSGSSWTDVSAEVGADKDATVALPTDSPVKYYKVYINYRN